MYLGQYGGAAAAAMFVHSVGSGITSMTPRAAVTDSPNHDDAEEGCDDEDEEEKTSLLEKFQNQRVAYDTVSKYISSTQPKGVEASKKAS